MSRQSVIARWAGEHRFDTGRANGPMARVDGSAETGQSPVDMLLSSLAACSGIDVVDIMAKRRTPVEALEIETETRRRDTPPKRVEELRITYRVDGAGIDRDQAERAVLLAFEKYCSVAASLRLDIDVQTQVVVNGQAGGWVKQALPAE